MWPSKEDPQLQYPTLCQTWSLSKSVCNWMWWIMLGSCMLNCRIHVSVWHITSYSSPYWYLALVSWKFWKCLVTTSPKFSFGIIVSEFPASLLLACHQGFELIICRKVLVMDFIEGTPILLMGDEMAKRGINPNGSIAKQVKRSGLYHSSFFCFVYPGVSVF